MSKSGFTPTRQGVWHVGWEQCTFSPLAGLHLSPLQQSLAYLIRTPQSSCSFPIDILITSVIILIKYSPNNGGADIADPLWTHVRVLQALSAMSAPCPQCPRPVRNVRFLLEANVCARLTAVFFEVHVVDFRL